MDPADHYFSTKPKDEARLFDVQVRLAGRDLTVQTASGVFSFDAVDKGTRALLDTVDNPPAQGRFLDIGSGWGPIALSLGLLSPQAEVTAVEVNERARWLTQLNAERVGLKNITALAPEDVPADAEFDLIWSNPPIRVGKQVLHEILRRWLPTLTPGGSAWMVVAKQLGGDSLHRWIDDSFEGFLPVERVDTVKGFRILRITRTQ